MRMPSGHISTGERSQGNLAIPPHSQEFYDLNGLTNGNGFLKGNSLTNGNETLFRSDLLRFKLFLMINTKGSEY